MPENGPIYLERTSGGRSGIVSVWAMVIEEFGEEADYGKGAWLMPRIPSAIQQNLPVWHLNFAVPWP
jgi:hypothetical protein